MHSFLFDAAWLCNDGVLPRFYNTSVCGFREFFTTKFMEEHEFNLTIFFNGAFGYHIHLKDAKNTIVETSYFTLFEKYFAKILKFK